MKVRDSGMPDEEMWGGFFEPAKVLATFGLDRGVQDLVEFGCGYGTFTLAAAAIASGTVHALDIEPDMTSRRPAEMPRCRGTQCGGNATRLCRAQAPVLPTTPWMLRCSSISCTAKSR